MSNIANQILEEIKDPMHCITMNGNQQFVNIKHVEEVLKKYQLPQKLIDPELFEETLKTYQVDSMTTLATCLTVLRNFPNWKER